MVDLVGVGKPRFFLESISILSIAQMSYSGILQPSCHIGEGQNCNIVFVIAAPKNLYFITKIIELCDIVLKLWKQLLLTGAIFKMDIEFL